MSDAKSKVGGFGAGDGRVASEFAGLDDGVTTVER